MINLNPPPVKTYHIHRRNQRERILEVAEGLFIRDGIDRVSISAIARAARVTRHTLYEYFPNKQEIAWAIFQKLVEDGKGGGADPPRLEGNGFQQLENLMVQMVNMLEARPQHSRFIVEFNTLYAREGSPARLREIAQQSRGAGPEWFEQAVCQGIADGSIRPDLDPGLCSAAICNLLTGMNARFALLGDLITQQYGQPPMTIYREICRAFLRGIQSTPASQENAR